MFIYLNLIGCPLTVKGKEHYKNFGACVIVCNHNSLMDVPVTTPFMARATKTIAKKSFANFPIFGWILVLEVCWWIEKVMPAAAKVMKT